MITMVQSLTEDAVLYMTFLDSDLSVTAFQDEVPHYSLDFAILDSIAMSPERRPFILLSPVSLLMAVQLSLSQGS